MGGRGIRSNAAPGKTADRQRICEAMLDLVASQGYAATTVRQVTKRAEVGGDGFKRLFAGKEDCFLQMYDEISERFTRSVFAAFEAEKSWRDGIRAAAYAAARWLRDHPREARYGALETVIVGETAQARHDATLRDFVDLLDAGRTQLEDPESVSRSMAEGVVGGIVAMLTKKLRHETPMRAKEIVPDLLFVAVRPYLGHEAAREELSIAPPRERDLEPIAERA